MVSKSNIQIFHYKSIQKNIVKKIESQKLLSLTFYFSIFVILLIKAYKIINISMSYKVTYKLKSEKNEITEIFYHKEEVSSIIKQINKWLTSIKKKLINWMNTLEYIIVIERNYDYIKNWIYHISKNINNNWEIIEVSLPLDNAEFLPIEKDITSELFYENNIGQIGNNNFYYKKWVLTIKWHIYNDFKKNTKYWNLMDLIFNVSNKKWLNILYTDIEEEFNHNTSKYNKLDKNDFNYERIRDTLKNKLRNIRKYSKGKKDIISLTTNLIIINQK